MASPRGHHLLTHTSDLELEAWGQSREECFEEAIGAVVESYAEVLDRATNETVPVAVDREDDASMLRSLLDEVVNLHDVLGVVPVSAELEPTEDGGVAGFLEVVPVTNVARVGAVPRGVDRHHVDVTEDGQAWHARATLSV